MQKLSSLFHALLQNNHAKKQIYNLLDKFFLPNLHY